MLSWRSCGYCLLALAALTATPSTLSDIEMRRTILERHDFQSSDLNIMGKEVTEFEVITFVRATGIPLMTWGCDVSPPGRCRLEWAHQRHDGTWTSQRQWGRESNDGGCL